MVRNLRELTSLITGRSCSPYGRDLPGTSPYRNGNPEPAVAEGHALDEELLLDTTPIDAMPDDFHEKRTRSLFLRERQEPRAWGLALSLELFLKDALLRYHRETLERARKAAFRRPFGMFSACVDQHESHSRGRFPLISCKATTCLLLRSRARTFRPWFPHGP